MRMGIIYCPCLGIKFFILASISVESDNFMSDQSLLSLTCVLSKLFGVRSTVACVRVCIHSLNTLHSLSILGEVVEIVNFCLSSFCCGMESTKAEMDFDMDLKVLRVELS